MIHKHQHFDLLQKVVLERVVFEPPLRANSSMHNEACFLFAIKGQSHLYSSDEHYSFKSSDGVIMKCGSYLNNWYDADGEGPAEAVAVHFYPDVLKHVYDDQLPDFLVAEANHLTKGIHRIKTDEVYKKYIDGLIFYFENPDLVNNDLIKLKVKEIILLLVNADSTGNTAKILRDMFNPYEYDFKQVIEKHLYDDLSLEELAILTNKSLSTFKRLFKVVYGSSPASYIKSCKLERAAGLLKTPGTTVSEVCFDCGFSDLTHFSKSFRSKYGVPPSQYKEVN